MRSAAAFQLSIVPSSRRLNTASFEYSTIAASCENRSRGQELAVEALRRQRALGSSRERELAGLIRFRSVLAVAPIPENLSVTRVRGHSNRSDPG